MKSCLQQKVSKDIPDPFRFFLDFCHVRYYEIKMAKIFSSLERSAFFFKKMCFQQPRRSCRNKIMCCTKTVKRPPGPF